MKIDQYDSNSQHHATTFYSLLLLIVITLGGCSTIDKPLEIEAPEVPPEAEALPEVLPEVLPEAIIVTPKEEAPIAPPLKPASPAPAIKPPSTQPLNVAILISRDIENHHIIYHKIEKLIHEKKGTVKPFYLYQQNETDIIEQIKDSPYQKIVAIGLEAAKTASKLPQTPVIFSQVYNYQDHNLVSEYIKGISLMPSIDHQFQAWKALFPGFKRIGTITGHGKQAFIDSAIKSAAIHDITLISRTVSNDKEMLSEFRRLTPQVDAFWLLPDNRILSKRTLRGIINYSTKHATPLLTINGLLLQAGAVISSTQIGDEIAKKVVSRLQSTNPDNTIPGADLEPLEQAFIFINTHATQRLNLPIPEGDIMVNLERWPSPGVKATLAQ